MDSKSFISSLFYILTIVAIFSGDSHCLKNLDKKTKYILYDVNVGEGFNLKRDVYMRMAMFVRDLAEKSEYKWKLVLPPWTMQWHWKSEYGDVSHQWHNFFDIRSLTLCAPVIEIEQFYKDYGRSVDEVYILQHFPEFYNWKGGDSNIDWSDKWSNNTECRDHPYWKKDDKTFLFFRGKHKVKTKRVRCISFQGSSVFLESVVSSTNATSIMFDRAEIATHMMYGDSNYWMCRRSMRFARHLIEAAENFRAAYLNSTDEEDKTVRPDDWRKDQQHRSAKGGPYLGVHLRRQDFLSGRPNEIPTLAGSAVQINNFLRQLNLTTVFIASDMAVEDYVYIKRLLEKDGVIALKYHPTKDEIDRFKEGGVAIIDQIIASHARYFVGTHESTFSYRIQEEREIMGFTPETTFNRFCLKNDGKDCTPPTRWLIKFPRDSSSITSGKKHRHFENDEL